MANVKPAQYAQLTDTPKLGFGCMRLPLTNKDDPTSIDIEQFKQMVDTFLEAGGTYFDTAFVYHNGASETALSEALVKRHPRDSYTIATKCLAWACPDEATAKSNLDTSLERLGTDYVDYYLLHNVGGDRTAVFDKWGMWEFAQEQKAAGKIKQLFESMDMLIDPLDNLSVALWAVIGTGKGLSAGLDIVPAIILGTVTANGGGIMRDIAMNREVQAFQAGTLYVTAALIGCIAYAVMHTYHILDNYAGITCVVLVLGVRYASRYFGWTTKPAKDYSHVVQHAAEKIHIPGHETDLLRKKHAQESSMRLFIRRLNGQMPNELPPANNDKSVGSHIANQDPDDGNDVY